jgi:hypothetical protein
MSDPKADLRHDIAETVNDLKTMIASYAWAKYSALLTEQVTGRIDGMILTPLASLDETLGQEYAKGEAAGLKLALAIVPSLIESMEQDIAAIDRRMENGNGNASS